MGWPTGISVGIDRFEEMAASVLFRPDMQRMFLFWFSRLRNRSSDCTGGIRFVTAVSDR
jgi:hypothetical protein